VKTFYCPSDSQPAIPVNGVFAYFTTAGTTLTGGYFAGTYPTLGRTNYTASAGALGNTTATPWVTWRGPYYVNSKTKYTDIIDGTSNTIGFGEMLGGSGGATRDFVASWMGAGALPTAWATIDPAQWYSFGSRHEMIVLFGRCDGSVFAARKVGTATDWYSSRWYNFQYAAGMSDGQVVNADNL
jgi:hypothetical protein